jgi:hypothetical protein
MGGMKILTFMKLNVVLALVLFSQVVVAQEIVGKWQLVKESTCIESELDPASEEEEEIISEMRSMSGPTTRVIEFKSNHTVTETTKIINRRKSYNSNALMYKFTGSAIHFLDKKSRTIIDSFMIERLSADSLIMSNAERACETRIFIKIK